MPQNKTEVKFFTAPLLIILATVLIDLIGFGMIIPVLPLYANTPPFNATPFEIGMLTAVYSLMQFIFSPILGRLSDVYGRRPILFISLLGSAVGYFMIGFADTLLIVFLGRIVGGVTGGNISTAQAYIADVTSPQDRARGMGLFGAAFGLGFVLGPGLSALLSPFGVHVPFYFAAVISALNAIALYFVLPETVRPGAVAARGKGRIAEMISAVSGSGYLSILTAIYSLLVTSFSILTYAFVLYTAHRFGYTVSMNGYLFMYIGLIVIFCQGWLFDRLVRRFGEEYLISTGCVLMALSLMAMPFVGPESGGLAALLIGGGILSVGNSLASPGMTSLASKHAEAGEQGQTLGIMQSAASLARAVGPLVGGVLLNNALNTIDDASIFRTFISAGAIMIAAFLVSLFLIRFRKN